MKREGKHSISTYTVYMCNVCSGILGQCGRVWCTFHCNVQINNEALTGPNYPSAIKKVYKQPSLHFWCLGMVVPSKEWSKVFWPASQIISSQNAPQVLIMAFLCIMSWICWQHCIAFPGCPTVSCLGLVVHRKNLKLCRADSSRLLLKIQKNASRWEPQSSASTRTASRGCRG